MIYGQMNDSIVCYISAISKDTKIYKIENLHFTFIIFWVGSVDL